MTMTPEEMAEYFNNYLPDLDDECWTCWGAETKGIKDEMTQAMTALKTEIERRGNEKRKTSGIVLGHALREIEKGLKFLLPLPTPCPTEPRNMAATRGNQHQPVNISITRLSTFATSSRATRRNR